MTPLQLLERFLSKDFGFPQAHALLGKVVEETEDRQILEPPPHSNLESAELEKLGGNVGALGASESAHLGIPQRMAVAALQGKSTGPPFLAGIILKFKSPEMVDFRVLEKRLGAVKEMARMKPWSDRAYRFLMKGQDYSGYILLMTSKRTQPVVCPIHYVIVRRFPHIDLSKVDPPFTPIELGPEKEPEPATAPPPAPPPKPKPVPHPAPPPEAAPGSPDFSTVNLPGGAEELKRRAQEKKKGQNKP